MLESKRILEEVIENKMRRAVGLSVTERANGVTEVIAAASAAAGSTAGRGSDEPPEAGVGAAQARE